MKKTTLILSICLLMFFVVSPVWANDTINETSLQPTSIEKWLCEKISVN